MSPLTVGRRTRRVMLPALLVTALAACLGGCSGSSETSLAEHLQGAKQALEERQYRTAVIHLKNALRQEPDNKEARWLLGRLYLESGNYPAAEDELLRAQALGVAGSSVAVPLAQAYLNQTKAASVLELPVVPQYPDAVKAELLATRAQAQLLLRDVDAAEREIGQALQLAKDHPYVLVARARVELARGRVEEAEKHISAALEVSGDYGPAWALRGDLSSAQGDVDTAITAYSRAIDARYKLPYCYLQRAMSLVNANQLEKAKADLAYVRKLGVKNFRIPFAEGVIAFHEKRFADAEQQLQGALRDGPDFAPTAFFLGATHLVQGHLELADRFLSQYLAANPQHVTTRNLLAIARYRLRNLAGAKEVLAPVVTSGKADNRTTQLYASILLSLGDKSEAVRLLEGVAAAADDAQSRTQLAIGLFSMGAEDRAFDNLEQALGDADSSKEAAIVYVVQGLARERYAESLAVAERLYKADPKDPLALTLMGLVHHKSNRPAEAEKYYRQALALKDDTFVMLRLVDLLVERGDEAQAEKLLQDALARHPANLPPRVKLLEMLARKPDVPRWLAVLNEGIKQLPDDMGLRVLQVAHFQHDDRPDLVMDSLAQLSPQRRRHPTLMPFLIRAELRLGLVADALADARQLVRARPDALEARVLLAQALEAANDVNELEKELTEILRLDAGSHAARLGLAKISVQRGDVPKAQQLLGELPAEQRDSFDGLVLQAQIAERQGARGKADAAWAALQGRAASEDEAARLFIALSRNQRESQALTLGQQWLQAHPDSMKIRLYMADTHMRTGAREQAKSEYGEILAREPGNVLALNNLAVLLLDDDPVRAKRLAQQAQQRAPQLASVVDTLVQALLANREFEAAKRELDGFESQGPMPYVLQYRRAETLLALGAPEKAKGQLQAIVAADVSPELKQKATALLGKL